MQLKKIIKLFIPPIILKIKNVILSSCKQREFRSNSMSTIASIQKNSEKFIVIGNGPSLNESIKKYGDIISSYDCIAVSHFCETAYYKSLKPKFYLLADPAFFGQLDTFSEWQRNKINGFIDAIIKNTEWDITLVIPSIATGSEFLSRIKVNPFIHPYFYNANDLVKYDETEKFNLWDKNLISVPAQTCLNTCVWLGIFLRYKEIYIIGADTNWIELLHVDQETNEVYINDTHFYGQKKVILYKDVAGKIPSTMAEELSSNANALKKYLELKDYADWADVKVYNASEYSLIDAFERKKI